MGFHELDDAVGVLRGECLASRGPDKADEIAAHAQRRVFLRVIGGGGRPEQGEEAGLVRRVVRGIEVGVQLRELEPGFLRHVGGDDIRRCRLPDRGVVERDVESLLPREVADGPVDGLGEERGVLPVEQLPSPSAAVVRGQGNDAAEAEAPHHKDGDVLVRGHEQAGRRLGDDIIVARDRGAEVHPPRDEVGAVQDDKGVVVLRLLVLVRLIEEHLELVLRVSGEIDAAAHSCDVIEEEVIPLVPYADRIDRDSPGIEVAGDFDGVFLQLAVRRIAVSEHDDVLPPSHVLEHVIRPPEAVIEVRLPVIGELGYLVAELVLVLLEGEDGLYLVGIRVECHRSHAVLLVERVQDAEGERLLVGDLFRARRGDVKHQHDVDAALVALLPRAHLDRQERLEERPLVAAGLVCLRAADHDEPVAVVDELVEVLEGGEGAGRGDVVKDDGHVLVEGRRDVRHHVNEIEALELLLEGGGVVRHEEDGRARHDLDALVIDVVLREIIVKIGKLRRDGVGPGLGERTGDSVAHAALGALIHRDIIAVDGDPDMVGLRFPHAAHGDGERALVVLDQLGGAGDGDAGVVMEWVEAEGADGGVDLGGKQHDVPQQLAAVAVAVGDDEEMLSSLKVVEDASPQGGILPGSDGADLDRHPVLQGREEILPRALVEELHGRRIVDEYREPRVAGDGLVRELERGGHGDDEEEQGKCAERQERLAEGAAGLLVFLLLEAVREFHERVGDEPEQEQQHGKHQEEQVGVPDAIPRKALHAADVGNYHGIPPNSRGHLAMPGAASARFRFRNSKRQLPAVHAVDAGSLLPGRAVPLAVRFPDRIIARTLMLPSVSAAGDGMLIRHLSP